MEETKALWQSKTFWGAIVVVLASAVGLVGITIDAEMQSEIVDLIMLLVTGIGGLLAIYGRIKANRLIK